ncbi:MAG: TIGR03862 family flavoprotein [Xanthobacteraceae bacterium]|nr:TIGR03862 family flavoprotein [Xanthobacteraceae bacterium]
MNATSAKNVAVIGAGPAGLIAAEEMAKAGLRVTVYERMPSAGRKFLLAGRGGLNLTHSEPFEDFLRRYGGRAEVLRAALESFPPATLRAWSESLGQKTFEGSSGRIFPEAFKASPLLRAWLRRLDEMGVAFQFRHRWLGWNEAAALSFDTPKGKIAVKADAVVLALGGASWPRLGSDGAWTDILSEIGVDLAPLQPANSGFEIEWSPLFRERFAGTPLKRIALSSGDTSVRGEATIADYGIEGGAIYALSSRLREEIVTNGSATLFISLRPDLDREALTARFASPRGKQSFSNFLRKAANLSPVAVALLQEWAAKEGRRLSDMPPGELAPLVNALPLTLSGIAPLETAISTAGGIRLEDLGENFMLRKLPGVFAAGEMLDWEAPTGGYLLQACFATGVAAGRGVIRLLSR